MKSLDDKPNIFLLVMDTARASNFSIYGYEKETDSEIKEIAKNGTYFTKCYSNSIWTLPSHYSMFTGKLPSHHGAVSKENKFTNLEALPGYLSKQGYRTAAVSNNAWISSFGGFEEIFDNFHFLGDSFSIEDKMLIKEDDLFKEAYEGEKDDKWSNKRRKYAYLVKESVKRFSPQTILNGAYYLVKEKNIRGYDWEDGAEKSNEIMRKEFEDEENPFFGFINYVEPHDPYTPPEGIAEEFLDERSYEEAMEESQAADLMEFLKNQDKNHELLEKLYDAEIKYLDKKIGELVKDIEDKSNRENIFIIVSDHGENFGEVEGLWGHYGKITENLTHVPLIIKGLNKGEIDENFSLRNLNDLVKSIAKGKPEIKTSEKVITEYWGLESHTWEIDTQEFDPHYLQQQKSVITDKFTLIGEDFDENADDKTRDYLSLRTGLP
jgi:arylsulfatase A-like enzyme